MQNDIPKVSIGIPVFNGERYLAEALDSILNQTFTDYEVIISDNASADQTRDICEYYQNKDRRIRFYANEENRGAAWNYNRVFELSKGKYFKWAAHDDYLAPNFLERCVRILDKDSSAILAYPRTVIVDHNGKTIENWLDDFDLRSPTPSRRYKQYHQRLLQRPWCIPVFGLIRRNILASTRLIGNYLESDRVLLAELVLRGAFVELPEHLFFRRFHEKMSVRAPKTIEENVAWWDPENRGKIVLPKLRLLAAYTSAITSAPINRVEKEKCFITNLWWLASDRRRKIRHELVRAAKKKIFGHTITTQNKERAV